MLQKTYTDGNYDNIWEAMFIICGLFREFASEVAKHNNFSYPTKDDENMIFYLKNRESSHSIFKY